MARAKFLTAAFLVLASAACSAQTPDAATAAGPAALKGYIIAEIEVADPEPYKDYLTAVTPMVEASGGKYIVRAGQSETPEGDPPQGRMVVLEFESYEAARAFYNAPDYQAILPLRTDNATSRIIILEGYQP